ncbi:beta-1,3-galactosyl-O-glycosyl-glycoprotein beta-1,6-N-acetylglucosaminyltransferase 3-like [Callorhinchus milii]|uniref:Beta-1,3-galactosyl-O-glycosyl-glycoprotein beta-1,6-N-acetylglucosaminyltransferase 3 n=1 Tax=Callorhinchus milii TaxID=7868 RepID=A0A4W3IAW2_CALMI|nr:beta-1,3-galactosyl-O-glycosyl-glycoprotein beta-1,6-N-acetylglucosaminyltransferase 3-like [Callorhinchus milii]|eukprot:gi/632938946/ref/XP_007907009.1/ PREDICTED: beta-1,3-galactosyl-O-glycosyl-glycoprotein beta-1,6-N-acetylglucosaminyltransferase 3-like [Callorhinchus milii]
MKRWTRFLLKLVTLTVLCSGAFFVTRNLLLCRKSFQGNWEEFGDPTNKELRYYYYKSLHLSDQGSVCSETIGGNGTAIPHTPPNKPDGSPRATRVTENDYLNMTSDCVAFKRTRKYVTFPLSEEEKVFPIAFSIVIHENVEMFERLLRGIYTPQNVYCIHVDRKSSGKFFLAVRAVASCFANVFLTRKLEDVVYASWSRVQADLNCMEDLLKSQVQWKYLLNLCGMDFPIKTNAEIVRKLIELNGKNSLESETPSGIKRKRWEFHHEIKTSVSRTDQKKSPPPIKTPMFTGNAYFVVSREFVSHLFSNPEIQNFMKWSEDTYSPDEHFWATLQRIPTVPGSYPPNSKYHMSDMASIARLVKWSYLEGNIWEGAPYPKCSGTHRHAVCVYGLGDLNWILQQHHLFANKFDPDVDDIALQCMEEYLRHKAIYGKGFV